MREAEVDTLQQSITLLEADGANPRLASGGFGSVESPPCNGRPIRFRTDRKGATSAHYRSVISLAYLRLRSSYWRRMVSLQGIVILVQLRNRTESQAHETTQLFSCWALGDGRFG